MNADGTDLRPITTGPTDERQPTWSPDGRFIAFSFTGENLTDEGIAIIRDDSSDWRRLTKDPGEYNSPTWREGMDIARSPAWSPDGKLIAFYGAVAYGTGGGGLWLMNADGSGLHHIDSLGNTHPNSADGPSWSPDGTSLTYWYTVMSHADIEVTSADGSTSPRELTKNLPNSPVTRTHWAADPAWSPDGKYIAFSFASDAYEFSGGGGWLYVMRADGSDARSLNVKGAHPSWSPDGRFIVFYQSVLIYRDQAYVQLWRIMAMSADGKNLYLLAELPAVETSIGALDTPDPSWGL